MNYVFCQYFATRAFFLPPDNLYCFGFRCSAQMTGAAAICAGSNLSYCGFKSLGCALAKHRRPPQMETSEEGRPPFRFLACFQRPLALPLLLKRFKYCQRFSEIQGLAFKCFARLDSELTDL
jgi:hypothetical protein